MNNAELRWKCRLLQQKVRITMHTDSAYGWYNGSALLRRVSTSSVVEDSDPSSKRVVVFYGLVAKTQRNIIFFKYIDSLIKKMHGGRIE